MILIFIILLFRREDCKNLPICSRSKSCKDIHWQRQSTPTSLTCRTEASLFLWHTSVVALCCISFDDGNRISSCAQRWLSMDVTAFWQELKVRAALSLLLQNSWRQLLQWCTLVHGIYPTTKKKVTSKYPLPPLSSALKLSNLKTKEANEKTNTEVR